MGVIFTRRSASRPRKDPGTRISKDQNSLPGVIEPDATLAELKIASQSCRRCDIWERATQAVFGEGAPEAEVMLVGEQPGNR
jgi:hypothetical protein